MTFNKAFVFILALFSFTVKAQTLKTFSEDNVKFPQELAKFLEETNRKDAQDLMTPFMQHWNGKSYSMDQKEAIYRTANIMLKKRMKAFPDFANYITALISFAKTKQSDESFEAWQTGLEKLLQGSNRYFSSFINTCNNLFLENTLYSSISTKWTVTADSYSFGFDSLPKIIFPAAELICYSKGDSSYIFKTQGVFYTSKNHWYGSGGLVTWESAGVSKDTIYAELPKKYMIEMSGSDYEVDSVVFYNKAFFPKPLIGKLSNKILANSTPETATYPRFDSYDKGIRIKNIQPDIDYEGGFGMKGANFLGSGSRDKYASLTFFKDKKAFIKASSRSFIIKPDKISSENTAIKIMLDGDSIFHPLIEMKFLKRKNELTLNRNESGISKSPFFDSYHQLDMFFDQMKWVQGDTVLDMKMISAAGAVKANFESINYFKHFRFDKIQGLEEQSPLVSLKVFAEKNKTRRFFAEDFAKFRRLSLSEIKTLLISLSSMGFLTYDLEKDEVFIKDKLYFFISSYFGKSDFDVLLFESLIGGKSNARLSLNNYNLQINGVSKVALSDSQNVYIIPRDQEIVVKKNRDFFFGGQVYAGRFEFFGKDFDFDYQNFKINLNNIDSLRFKVPNDSLPPDELGRKPLLRVKSVVEHVTGNLLIDKPDNKSGRVDQPSYPIFNSIKDSYVFYDRPSIQGGVYDRNKFYFHLVPFTVDSLDNFTREGLAFTGDLVSADIFPLFTDTLKLQKDLSLGFVRQTPEKGFPAYKGKGTYTSTIYLSNEGLRGNGKLDYLSSVAKSYDFIFFPDSTNGLAYEYEIRKENYGGTAFPAVKGTDVLVHWMPYLDYMDVKQKNTPFDMYENNAQMAGNLVMAPGGLSGNGTVSLTGAELQSSLFKFGQTVFDSDTSSFRLKSDISDVLAFNSTNVKSHIDMEKREGDFKSNNPDDYVKLPINQYIAYVDQYKWLMDKKEIDLGAGDKAPAEGYKYISVKQGQDSLTFNSPLAKYRLTDYVLGAEKVKHIKVADATVFPDSGKVVVQRNAVMDTLLHARIIADTSTQYHTLYNATVNVLGRLNFTGSGDYDYTNSEKLKRTLHFSEIGVDSLRTYAIGEISDTSDFTLSPQISYKGRVELRSYKKYLNYSGYGRMRNKCVSLDRRWFKFSSEINPDSVIIPVNQFVDDTGQDIAVAIGMGSDSAGSSNLTPMFLTRKSGPGRDQFLAAKGFLDFDKTKNEFRISSMERLEDNTVPDDYISFNDTKCTWYGEGKINLSNDFGRIKTLSRGSMAYNLNNQDASMNLLLGLDFYFSDEALKAFSEELVAVSTLDPSEAENPAFEKVLSDLLGKDKATEFLAELALYGNVKKMPKELDNTLLITHVKLNWDSFNKSFRSEGKIDVGSINKVQVNRQMNGKIELIKRGSGDILNIYLEADEFGWYFFSFDNDVMQAISSNEVFNDAIRNEKPEKMELKAEKGKPAYQYMLSTEKKKNEFLRKVGYRVR
jgi:hypothetical protein